MDPSASEDESIHEDLHTMVKVEVHEQKTPPPASTSAPPPLVPATPTPPPSTSAGLRMPPLHLRQNPEQVMLNHTAELLAKQNMFFFGDVTVAEHPDAPPVPMVIPMAYLYPLPSANKENVKYRMFVPLGGGMGPEIIAPPGMPPIPPVPQVLPTPTPPVVPSPSMVSPLPKLEKIRPESRESSENNQGRKSGDTTPLDLSKSPEVNTSLNSDSEETIIPDQRPLPPLRRVSIIKEDELRKTSPNPQLEAQLQFFKAKQLEFLKGKNSINRQNRQN